MRREPIPQNKEIPKTFIALKSRQRNPGSRNLKRDVIPTVRENTRRLLMYNASRIKPNVLSLENVGVDGANPRIYRPLTDQEIMDKCDPGVESIEHPIGLGDDKPA